MRGKVGKCEEDAIQAPISNILVGVFGGQSWGLKFHSFLLSLHFAFPLHAFPTFRNSNPYFRLLCFVSPAVNSLVHAQNRLCSAKHSQLMFSINASKF